MQTLDDPTFRHMFRMTRATFSVLCTTIEEKVGEEVFKSELWLSCRKVPPPGSNVKGCAFSPVGGPISGDVIMIRMLLGVSYPDILFGYCVATCTVFNVFHEGIVWVQETFSFPLAQS